MLSIFLQIGALWNIIVGIIAATAAGASDYIDENTKKGKFDFWYQ
jgi:hypothetical protein